MAAQGSTINKYSLWKQQQSVLVSTSCLDTKLIIPFDSRTRRRLFWHALERPPVPALLHNPRRVWHILDWPDATSSANLPPSSCCCSTITLRTPQDLRDKASPTEAAPQQQQQKINKWKHRRGDTAGYQLDSFIAPDKTTISRETKAGNQHLWLTCPSSSRSHLSERSIQKKCKLAFY